MRRRLTIAAFVVVLAGTLWYLRDPAWLSGQTTGLRGWERGPDGTAYRWTGGHASFFVPANSRHLRLSIATTFDSRSPHGDEPMLVTFTIDDVRAGRALLVDPRPQAVVLEMPPPASRRVRRVDVRTKNTREGNHGVKISGVMVTTDGMEWRPCCLVSR